MRPPTAQNIERLGSESSQSRWSRIRSSSNRRTNRVIAEGSVEVYYGNRTLTADRIVYDHKTGRIAATGPIVLRDASGATVFADAAELDADLVDGLVQWRALGHGRAHPPRGSRGAARSIIATIRYRRRSTARVRSAPKTRHPLWRIRARRVIHDEEAKVIHYEDATFDVHGASRLPGFPISAIPIQQ